MSHAKLYIYQQESAKNQFIDAEIAKHKIHSADLITFGEDSIGIAQIRKLKQRIAQKPFASQYTLVVLSAQALSPEAQQALLKTIEEPPPQTKLIIVSPKLDLLLPTIQSRVVIRYENVQEITQLVLPDEVMWQKLLKSSIGQRLKDTEQFPSDRAALIVYLTTAIKFYRHELLHIMQKKPISTPLTEKQLTQLLQTISHTVLLLHANVAVKLALDFLVIHSPFTR
ncbi:hypothetical protein C4579_02755 [Candidatus Microgenomates bacterium]|nr:MAG: hypothetical protein C4579_02755 [Candidatus Microgenomates bacterium]